MTIKDEAIDFWKKRKKELLDAKGIKDKSRLEPSEATIEMLDLTLLKVKQRIEKLIKSAEIGMVHVDNLKELLAELEDLHG